MEQSEKIMRQVSLICSHAAGIAVVVMMLLSTADVVLRFFGRPITGAYEIVGFLGILVVSFALARTSMEKGNIAVDILVNLFPRRVQAVITLCNHLVGAVLFGLISWQSLMYGLELKRSGEVSLTLGMPVYPFALGIAVGCGLLTLSLFAESLSAVGKAAQK